MRRADMSTITRMWMGFGAVCAGIIHLALIVSSPLPVAILLGIVGVVECMWGVLTFIRERLIAPRVVLIASLVPTLLWAALVAVAAAARTPAIASYLGFAAMIIATVFELFISAVIAVQIRKGADLAAATRSSSAVRYLLGVVVGGVLAAMLVTPALAATDAGKYAKPMGDMAGMNMGAPTLITHSDQ
jgi:hypothetical protein